MEDITFGGMTITPENPDYEKVRAKKAQTEAKRERWKEAQRKLQKKIKPKQEDSMEEIRRGGYTIKKDETSTTGDSNWMMSNEKFGKILEWKKEVNDKLKKLSDIIHGIQMQLGRINKQIAERKAREKKTLDILEAGEKKNGTDNT